MPPDELNRPEGISTTFDTSSGSEVRVLNEIVYEDDQGVMQFLRRTPLAGAFKFQNQSSQTVPNELLTHFETSLDFLSELLCIGYGFGDQHVNMAIRNWLEGSADRRISIVDPNIEAVPALLMHLSPQVELVNMEATDYFDKVSGIERTAEEKTQRQFSSWARNMDRDEVGMAVKQYMDQLIDGAAKDMAEWVQTLPIRDGNIDLQAAGLTMDDLIRMGREKVSIPSPEKALEDFLKRATDSE